MTSVLVVDDSAVARQALATVLETEGCAVTTAASAHDARREIATVSAGAFDLVLMDLHLPDGTGIDACAHIKGRPGWEDVPVIMVTSSDDGRDLAQAFAAGATDYLTKPPRDIELRARVRAALRLKQEMDRRKARERDLERLNGVLTSQAAELTAARGALLDLNDSLERRVRQQVEEILTHAREIEGLNAQLRVQVQERSRELAEALRRLSARDRVPRPLAAGTELAGRVRIGRTLGRGGMGCVYRAEDLLTGGDVAVKVLDLQIGSDARDLRRFIDEAAAAAAIPHPAIVKTRHVDVSPDGHPYLIMELVEGTTLDGVLAAGPLTADRCVAIAAVVADALDAAHRSGVVHRDIKPSNLMIGPAPPGVRVLDFGISKSLTASDRPTWTGTGHLLGTPAYMSPEQFENAAAVTPASDVYSLGAVMYEMVTGTPPGFGERAPCPAGSLGTLIDRCLARDPAARPTAAEIRDALAGGGR